MTQNFLSLCPFAVKSEFGFSESKDIFATGSPVGVTIHYTADRKLERAVRSLKEKNLAYHLLITRGGEVIQMADLTKAVSHAGNASWRGFSPNKTHLSVALVSWGELKFDGSSYKAWNGTQLLPSEVRTKDNRYWDRATDEQEAALMKVLKWFVSDLNIDPLNICGHDECAIPAGRKSDPGHILSLTCLDIRTKLSSPSHVA